MPIEFTKMHGLGNDFIVFEAADAGAVPGGEQLRRLANRHTGIGFDQALVITPPQRAGTLAYYRIFNADGSEVEQCGNGVRCIAEWLRLAGRGPSGEFTLDSPGGPIAARILEPGLVAVDMGVPDFAPRALPFRVAAEAPSYQLEIAGQPVEFGAVSMGNPHIVIDVPNAALAAVATLGPALEVHAAFPRRVNVGFMQIVDPGHIRLRVFERGVGETLACGTGACAAVAVGRKAGRLAEQVEVSLPGGTLSLRWPGPGARLWMTGPAAVAYRGRVEL
jgi:diaminopimelate epimerase